MRQLQLTATMPNIQSLGSLSVCLSVSHIQVTTLKGKPTAATTNTLTPPQGTKASGEILIPTRF